jgi:MFS family permease
VVARRGFVSLVQTALRDLFDQSTAFGRLALVHVVMMAGDTLVTISLAGSLFFSVSPDAAKSKVLLYLFLTIAPFAVVSPLLGPLIDRAAGGRRVLVAAAAGVRVLVCWLMSGYLTSLWLFPLAFVVLVSSKLYGVTRGALVPEMARRDEMGLREVSAAGWPRDEQRDRGGFAGYNAQLTLLGTVSGLFAGALGAAVLKTLGASAVLLVASLVFALATVLSTRLRRSRSYRSTRPEGATRLARGAGVELSWSLSASALMRFSVGFASFLVAFSLRRLHASLGWYGVVLGASALGSLLGLAVVTRLRTRIAESLQLVMALAATGLGGLIASQHPALGAQAAFAGWLGLWSATAQPSFDSITQRLVPPGAQGRIFARFAVRQQLAWVVGALLPVAFPFGFRAGDEFVGTLLLLGAIAYALRGRVQHFG